MRVVSTRVGQPTPHSSPPLAASAAAAHPPLDRAHSATPAPPSRPDRPTVIVTDANHSISIPFIRSLARAGWRVVAASHDRDGVGIRSRYAAERVIHPSPGREPAAFVEAVAAAARRHDASLVVPLSEATVLALIEHRDLLPEDCRLAIADRRAFEVAVDKRRTLALAQELGIPAPRTGVASTVEQAVAVARAMAPPYVLKPSSTRRRITGVSRLGTLHARDVAGVAAQAARLLPDDDGVLVQEYVPGHGVGVNLLTRDGVPLMALQHRRLRELPVWGGTSALRESVAIDRALFADATALLGALRWTGLAMVEFRVDGARYRLMEINGRAWGSIALAVAAGVDFPAGLAGLYADGDDGTPGAPSPNGPAVLLPYELGVRSRNLQLDILWILSVMLRRPPQDVIPWPSRGRAVQAMLELLDPRIRFDVLSRDDPRPGAQEIVNLVHLLVRQAMHR